MTVVTGAIRVPSRIRWRAREGHISIAQVDDRALVRPEERPHVDVRTAAGEVPGEEDGLTFRATQLESVDDEEDP